jgi:isopenicillin N synthase-like dioxygenase
MRLCTVDLNRFLHAASAARKNMAEALDRGLRDHGFFLVCGHGVPERLMADLTRVSHSFFALPFAAKNRIAQPDPGTMRGYVAMGRESLAHSREQATPPDLNESFMMGQPDVRKMDRPFAPNLWPESPADLKVLWTDYYGHMERVAVDLLKVFAVALSLHEEFFERIFVAHTSRLRARYYPRHDNAPQPGQLRAGAHTDYGSLAILLAQDRGLQFCSRSGDWNDVPIVDGCFIVNIGDLMARWTNDRWTAALHRVVNPPWPHPDEDGRLSHIFFHSPSDDTLVTCLDACCGARHPPRYAPVRAGDYLRMKCQKVRSEGSGLPSKRPSTRAGAGCA